MNKTILTTSFALLLAGFSCKPSSSSDVQSLDNFTRADGASVKQNRCGYPLTETVFKKMSTSDQKALDYIEAPNRKLALDAMGAMAAVPRPLLALFFKLDGRVRIVDDAGAACGDAKLSSAQRRFAGEGADKLDGCWNVNGKRLEVIVRADHAAIHHAMVRTFGYVYTQFLASYDLTKLSAKDRAAAEATLAQMNRQKKAVGDALLADLAKKGGKTSARFASFSAGDETQFNDFTLGETIDSYYCSKQTLATFKKDFPLTFAAFTGPGSLQSDLGKAFHE